MKNKSNTYILYVLIVLLIGLSLYNLYNPRIVHVDVPTPYLVEAGAQEKTSPEFRNPPIKEYKPGHVQQMGVLIGENEETLPLYGREVSARRDRYHFYTTSGGENLYPLPISHENRDCMDDIGCNELYGNEDVSVTGKTGTYNVQMYRTDNFF